MSASTALPRHSAQPHPPLEPADDAPGLGEAHADPVATAGQGAAQAGEAQVDRGAGQARVQELERVDPLENRP